MVYEINDSSNFTNYQSSPAPELTTANTQLTPEEFLIYSSKLEEMEKDIAYLKEGCDALGAEIDVLEKDKDALTTDWGQEKKLEALDTKIKSKKDELSNLQIRHDNKSNEYKSTYEEFTKRL